MNKLLGGFLALLMVLGIVFIGDAVSSNGSLSASAQTVTVRHKRRGVGSKTYRGGKYVAKKTWHGTKYAGRKTWHGTRYVGRKTVKGTRWTAHKTKRGTKHIFHKTKRALN